MKKAVVVCPQHPVQSLPRRPVHCQPPAIDTPEEGRGCDTSVRRGSQQRRFPRHAFAHILSIKGRHVVLPCGRRESRSMPPKAPARSYSSCRMPQPAVRCLLIHLPVPKHDSNGAEGAAAECVSRAALAPRPEAPHPPPSACRPASAAPAPRQPRQPRARAGGSAAEEHVTEEQTPLPRPAPRSSSRAKYAGFRKRWYRVKRYRNGKAPSEEQRRTHSKTHVACGH